MFRDDASQEQMLYQAIAKSGTLLLQIGDVAKQAENMNEKNKMDILKDRRRHVACLSISESADNAKSMTNENFVFVPKLLDSTCSSASSSTADFLSINHEEQKLNEKRFETSTPLRSTNNVNLTPVSDQPVPNISADSTQLGTVDLDWSIRYRQFLACMLSEPIFGEYFEKAFGLMASIDKYKREGEYRAQIFSP